jgi:hypothetical protein
VAMMMACGAIKVTAFRWKGLIFISLTMEGNKVFFTANGERP